MSNFKNLNNAEDNVYILIMNDKKLLEVVRNMRTWSMSSIENTMNNTVYRLVYKDINVALRNKHTDLLLVFLHVMESGDMRDIRSVNDILKARYSKKLTIVPQVGDIVQHTCNPDLIGEIVSESIEENKWKISYINSNNIRVTGKWLKEHVHLYTTNTTDESIIRVGNIVCRKNNLKEKAIVQKRTINQNKDIVLIVKYPDGLKTDWFEYNAILCDSKPSKNTLRGLNDKVNRPTEVLCDDIGYQCDPSADKLSSLTDLKNVQEEIVEHFENAIKSFKKVATNLPPVTYKLKPEHTMKTEIKTIHINGVLTGTLVNDQDVATMDASGLLHIIGNIEAAIIKLEKHNNKSKFIKQEINRLTEFVKNVYKILDEKFAKADGSEEES